MMSLEKRNLTANLARVIRKHRKSLGLTQKQLGQFAGCGVAFIYLLEKGKPTVRLDKLLDVLIVLGLQIKLEVGKAGIEIDEDLR